MAYLETRVVLDGDGEYQPPGAGLVAVDIDTSVGVEFDVFGEIAPDGYYNGEIAWQDTGLGAMWPTPFGTYMYTLSSFHDQTEYESQETAYEARIDAWANRMIALIDAEYSQQRSGLTMLQAYLTTQNQANSFWGQFGAVSGVGGLAGTTPFGIATVTISACSWVASYHASDPAPNFTAYWGEALDKITDMELLAKSYIETNRTWMKLALVENIPSAVALTTDEIPYWYFNNTDGTITDATITVDLEGRIDYTGRLFGLMDNFAQIEPLIENPYYPVHRALAVYGDALLAYATSAGMQVEYANGYLDYGTGYEPPVWVDDPRWYSPDFQLPFTFGGDDIADELNSIRFMLPGFEVYMNVP